MTPKIVAIGGTVNPGSTTELAMRTALDKAAAEGAEVTLFDGAYLAGLAHYRGPGHKDGDGAELVQAVRAADGMARRLLDLAPDEA